MQIIELLLKNTIHLLTVGSIKTILKNALIMLDIGITLVVTFELHHQNQK